jgi:hypothetical protein
MTPEKEKSIKIEIAKIILFKKGLNFMFGFGQKILGVAVDWDNWYFYNLDLRKFNLKK